MAATPSATAGRSSGSPYHLDIPGTVKGELSRWSGNAKGSRAVVSEELRAGRRYRLEGACIYGYSDQLTYEVLNANAERPRNPVLATGAISCDGEVKTRTLILKRNAIVQLAAGQMGEKTIGYLLVLA